MSREGRLRLVAHRVGTSLARAVMRTRPRHRPSDDSPSVCWLLAHAWGAGGTIRTTIGLAGSLDGRHETSIASLVRLRGRSTVTFPDGLVVTAIDDQRRAARDRLGGVSRWLSRRSSVLIHPSDGLWRRCSLLTDVRLLQTLWCCNADVIVGTRPSLVLVVAALAPRGVRTVGHEHLNLASRPPHIRAALIAAARRLDVVVTLTERDRAAYTDALGTGTRVVAIPNATPELGGEQSTLTRPVVLSAGRMTRQKGQSRLIEAFALLSDDHPEWTLRICGAGPLSAALADQAQAAGIGDRVSLPGRVTDMAAEYAGASMFALSSRFEGFPMVLLEAMSKGLPVVSMDCPTGPRELVADGHNGVLVPADDIKALHRGMRALIEDPARRRALGVAAQDTASRYHPAVIAGYWTTVLATIAAQPVRRRRRVLIFGS